MAEDNPISFAPVGDPISTTLNIEDGEPMNESDVVAHAWVVGFNQLGPTEQRRELLTLLQTFRTSPSHSPEALESVIDPDQAWYPIAFQLARNYRWDPTRITNNPAKFHAEMASLELAFAEAYAGFADSLTASGVDPTQDMRFPKVSALALFHFGKYAKYKYFSKEQPEAEFWERVHKFYLLAEGGNFLDSRLMLFPNEAIMSTCRQLWLRVIMLATIGTGNFTPRQIDRSDEWLEAWCQRINVDPTYDPAQHIYGIDFAAARGPQRVNTETQLAQPGYFSTKHLHRDIAQARSDIVSDTASANIGWHADNPLKEYFELLDQLQRMWVLASSLKTSRVSKRTRMPEGEDVEVVRGIEAINKLHNFEADPPEIELFSVIDSSSTGLGVFLPNDRLPLSNMELLALRARSDPQWQIGQVVRITTLPEKETRWTGGRLAGIQLLTRAAISIGIAKTTAVPAAAGAIPDVLSFTYGGATPDEKAFYLVGDIASAVHQADSLLAVTGAYVPGDKLKLQTANNPFTVRINRVIQGGDGWERTGFEVVEKVALKPKPKP